MCHNLIMDRFVIQKSYNNPLVADVTTTVPSIMGRIPGQMPSRKDAEIKEFMLRKPRKEADIQKDYPRPVLTIEEIPRNLGFDSNKERDWTFFLNNSIGESRNDVALRQDIFRKIYEDKIEAEQAKVLVQKVLCYLKSNNVLNKSLVNVYSIVDNTPKFIINVKE